MRWRAFYFKQMGENCNEESQCADDENIENSRFKRLFKSEAKPPFIEEMEQFEKEILELPKKLEYRKYINEFQRTIKENLSNIKENNSNKVIVTADKTRNYYVCDLQKHETLTLSQIWI